MHRKFLVVAALLAAMAVAFGAFATHGLNQIVEEETVKIFQRLFNTRCIIHWLYC